MFVQYFDGSVEGIRGWICCSCQPGADIIQPSEGQEGSLFGSRWGIVANRVECHTATDLAEIQKLVREECVISDVICTASAPAPFRRNSQINDPVIHQCQKVPFVQGCLTVIVLLLSSDTLGPACGTKHLTRGCGGSTYWRSHSLHADWVHLTSEHKGHWCLGNCHCQTVQNSN